MGQIESNGTRHRVLEPRRLRVLLRPTWRSLKFRALWPVRGRGSKFLDAAYDEVRMRDGSARRRRCFQELMVGRFSFRRSTLPRAGHGHRRGGTGEWPGDGADPSRIEDSFLGRALRAGVANRAKRAIQGGRGVIRRDTGRRFLPCNEKGALAGMGIAAVPHPAVLLAFADSAGVEQNRPAPSFDRPEG